MVEENGEVSFATQNPYWENRVIVMAYGKVQRSCTLMTKSVCDELTHFL